MTSDVLKWLRSSSTGTAFPIAVALLWLIFAASHKNQFSLCSLTVSVRLHLLGWTVAFTCRIMYMWHMALASFHCLQLYRCRTESPRSVGWTEFVDENQLPQVELEHALMLATRKESLGKCFRTSAIPTFVKFSHSSRPIIALLPETNLS